MTSPGRTRRAPAVGRELRTAARSRFGRNVATTAVANLVSTGTAGVTGIVIARTLGPAGRGEYAAIVTWFGVILVVGELGQTAATTYFVAREPRRAPAYLATARTVMLASGSVVLVLGIILAPLLAPGDSEMVRGYRLMFAACVASFIAASYIFSLQAVHIEHWNVARVAQPAGFLLAVVLLDLAGHLGLMSTLAALVGTIVAQTALAWWLCGRHRLTGGRPELALASPLTRYGAGQLAASVPGVVTGRLDQLVLSVAVAPALLGHYAVATSLAALAVPLASALGSVAFPRIAADSLSTHTVGRLQWRAVGASAAVAVVVMLPLAGLAPWLVPRVFGADYRQAVGLVELLAPGGVLLAVGQVCGDLLRGHNQPYAVARAQAVAAAVTVLLLATLVPLIGVAGAAVASSVAAAVALVLMLRALARIGTL